MTVFEFCGVSPGIALGPVVRLERTNLADPDQKGDDANQERSRVDRAWARAESEVDQLGRDTRDRLGSAQAEIFDAHRAMLGDPELKAAIDEHLLAGWNAETAVYRGCQFFIDLLSQLEDEAPRSRAEDLADLRRRLLGHLGGAHDSPLHPSTPSILVAEDLSPSETVGLDPSRILGFVTVAGSRTSHASILARSLGIPAATGAGSLWGRVRSGQIVSLDGATGRVVLEPDADERQRTERSQRRYAEHRALEREFAHRATVTADGHHVDIAANIGRLEDLPSVLEHGAEGIGLFRTEVLFLDRDRTPSEDEQTAVYRHVLERLEGKPVVIRTLDIGGDKVLPYLPQPHEENPFLGVRAVRLCLEQPELFRTQIRALLRASTAGPLHVMVPMVALVEELRAVRALFDEERARLTRSGVKTDPIQLGIMIEIPAAALNARALAAEADFFSIGTNDLIQYTMAADRMNERLNRLYQPLHPSVLRLIHETVQGAHAHSKWVGVCGEMASAPDAALVLVGLGVDELSLSARGIGGLRALLATVDHGVAQETARLALACGTSDEVRGLLLSRHPELNHQGDLS